MSFSSEVKNEMLSVVNKPCCSFAQSYGFLLFGRSFSLKGVSLMTDYENLARAYEEAVRSLGGKSVRFSRSDAGRYTVLLPPGVDCRRVLSALGYDGSERRTRLNYANLLRGVVDNWNAANDRKCNAYFYAQPISSGSTEYYPILVQQH